LPWHHDEPVVSPDLLDPLGSAPAFRNGIVVGVTTGVRDASRLMIDCASSSRPRCP
jgi:hypothetical protein